MNSQSMAFIGHSTAKMIYFNGSQGHWNFIFCVWRLLGYGGVWSSSLLIRADLGQPGPWIGHDPIYNEIVTVHAFVKKNQFKIKSFII